MKLFHQFNCKSNAIERHRLSQHGQTAKRLFRRTYPPVSPSSPQSPQNSQISGLGTSTNVGSNAVSRPVSLRTCEWGYGWGWVRMDWGWGELGYGKFQDELIKEWIRSTVQGWGSKGRAQMEGKMVQHMCQKELLHHIALLANCTLTLQNSWQLKNQLCDVWQIRELWDPAPFRSKCRSKGWNSASLIRKCFADSPQCGIM
jgi:hypothetical protein